MVTLDDLRSGDEPEDERTVRCEYCGQERARRVTQKLPNGLRRCSYCAAGLTGPDDPEPALPDGP